MQPGALIFSPPTAGTLMVEKFHICADCWPAVAEMIKDKNLEHTDKTK